MIIKPVNQPARGTIRACLAAAVWLGGLLAAVLTLVAGCHALLHAH